MSGRGKTPKQKKLEDQLQKILKILETTEEVKQIDEILDAIYQIQEILVKVKELSEKQLKELTTLANNIPIRLGRSTKLDQFEKNLNELISYIKQIQPQKVESDMIDDEKIGVAQVILQPQQRESQVSRGRLLTTCPQMRDYFDYNRLLFVDGYNQRINKIDACFNNMFSKKGGYNYKNIKDFLFKIDSIHDFTKERGNKDIINDIIDNLGFGDDKYKYLTQDKDLETSVFFWFVIKVMQESDMSGNYINELKKTDFRESIQYYQEIRDIRENSNFVVDAGLKEYSIFLDILTAQYTLQNVVSGLKKIEKNRTILEDWFNELEIEFKKHNKNEEYYIFYSLGRNLIYAYENLLLDFDDLNLDEIALSIFTKYTANVRTGVNYNERLKNKLVKLRDRIEPIIENEKIQKLVNIYLKYIYETPIRPDRTEFSKSKLEFSTLKIPKGIQEEIDRVLTRNTKVKVIAPQKFDANRTTGGGVDVTNILKLDNCQNLDDGVNNSDCSFNILDDTCYFYSTKPDAKGNIKFIFEFKDEINTQGYPIRKVIIVNKDQLKDYTTYPDINRFKYDETNRTLICSNAPGVTELTDLYDIFTKKYIGYENAKVLKNILQIKRGGDYSQIWFCKKWNDTKSNNSLQQPTLFFMSNDRQSATFCLLEKVPYIGQVGYYSLYFNPKGSIITNNNINEKLNTKKAELMTSILNGSFFMEITSDILYFYSETENKEILDIIKRYLAYITYYGQRNMVYGEFETDMLTIANSLKNIIDNKIDSCNIDIKLINKTFIEIEDKIKNEMQTEIAENIVNLYTYIKETFFSENSIFTIFHKCKDIAEILEIKDFKCPEEMKAEDEEMKDYGEYKVINLPDYNREEVDKLNKSKGLKCRELYYQISELYYYFINNWRYFSDEDKEEYEEEYNKLYDCLYDHDAKQVNTYFPEGKYMLGYTLSRSPAFIIPSSSSSSYPSTFSPYPSLSDTTQNVSKKRKLEPSSSSQTSFQFSSNNIQRDHFGFSFENGLTYYHIYPDTPSTINMNKYNNANNVYIADKKGMMKVENHKSNGKIHINKASLKHSNSKEYTDGTKISYYSF